MQAHTEKETGRLTEGADYKEKEGGLRVLTRQGVNKVAELLRHKRLQAQQAVSPPPSVTTADDEKKEDVGAPATNPPADEKTMAMALRDRNLPNRKQMACMVNGKQVSVLVRDTAFYRQGEKFEVRQNEYGHWEAVQHRTQPRFR